MYKKCKKSVQKSVKKSGHFFIPFLMQMSSFAYANKPGKSVKEVSHSSTLLYSGV